MHTGSRLVAVAIVAAAALPGISRAQAPAMGTSPAEIARIADSVAGSGSSYERTRRLVHWVNDDFNWLATDYVKRTPEEVIARRGGNCAELASVLHTLLSSLHIRSRWVREINVQPEPTPRREADAEKLVATKGKSYSVFGLQHNDHVWLEVWDDRTRSWFPADPAYGVVGLDEWLEARLSMERRPKPRVAAVEPIAADMLVPFVVLAGDSLRGQFTIDRTQFYLIDGFDRLYLGKLASLPAWSVWTSDVDTLSRHALGAFAGREDLHAYNAQIAHLKATYDSLAAEAAKRGYAHRVSITR